MGAKSKLSQAERMLRDKVSKAAYYLANKERLRALNVAWKEANPNRSYELNRRWKEKNVDHVRQKRHESYIKNKALAARQSTEWAAKNPERTAANSRVWKKKNRQYVRAYKAVMRATKLKATPGWANKFFIKEIYDLASRRTKLKSGGYEQWDVDHIVPLNSPLVCGLHVEHNLQIIPRFENQAKSNIYWPGMP